MGNVLNYQYHICQQAWNCYLRLVDIDYIKVFACPTCKNRTIIVIFDGIAKGTTKGVPKRLNNFDEQQKLSIIPVAERILIVRDDIRKMLVQYAAMGMANPSFDEILENVEIPEFKNYLNHTSHICGTLTIVDPESPNVIEIIKLFAK